MCAKIEETHKKKKRFWLKERCSESIRRSVLFFREGGGRTYIVKQKLNLEIWQVWWIVGHKFYDLFVIFSKKKKIIFWFFLKANYNNHQKQNGSSLLIVCSFYNWNLHGSVQILKFITLSLWLKKYKCNS